MKKEFQKNLKIKSNFARSFLFFLLFSSGSSFCRAADRELGSPLQSQANKFSYRFIFTLGQEVRSENNTSNEYVYRNLSNLDFGVGVNEYNVLIEKSDFSDSSGNSTLKVLRNYQAYAVWAQYQIDKFQWGVPFLTVGIGTAQNKVDSDLLGIRTSNESDWRSLGGVGCGFRAPVRWLWVSAEARVIRAEGWDPSTSVYLLGRVGIRFE